MDIGLKGKKAVVAASSQGIGFAIFRELLNEGPFVLMNGHDSKTLENSRNLLGNPVSLKIIAGDVTDQKVCKEIIKKAINEFDGLYSASNLGRLKKGEILKKQTLSNNDKYYFVTFFTLNEWINYNYIDGISI